MVRVIYILSNNLIFPSGSLFDDTENYIANIGSDSNSLNLVCDFNA